MFFRYGIFGQQAFELGSGQSREKMVLLSIVGRGHQGVPESLATQHGVHRLYQETRSPNLGPIRRDAISSNWAIE